LRIGLIDFGNQKMPNLALMKLSAYHKSQGDRVMLGDFLPSQVDRVYCSVLFSWDRREASKLAGIYPNIEFGGTGWDIHKKLPLEIEAMAPDFSLYSADYLYGRLKGIRDANKRLEKADMLVKAGIGRTDTGCSRKCPHCLVPKAEGDLRKVNSLASILNPASNNLLLLNNNLTAQTDCLDLLDEIRDRNIRVSITQGVDVREVTPEIAKALSRVKLLGRQLHYSWDYPQHEGIIFQGIRVLSEFVGTWKQMCYCLVGYNTTWEEDVFRFRKLTENGIDPYIMLYNKGDGTPDARLRHFSRWVNARIYKTCPDFEQYRNWSKVKSLYENTHPMLLPV
jgi:hypothetical protein